MYALMLVFYPECNQGSSCRTIIDVYEDFEDLIRFTEICDPEDMGEESKCGKPGWDYLDTTKEN